MRELKSVFCISFLELQHKIDCGIVPQTSVVMVFVLSRQVRLWFRKTNIIIHLVLVLTVNGYSLSPEHQRFLAKLRTSHLSPFIILCQRVSGVVHEFSLITRGFWKKLIRSYLSYDECEINSKLMLILRDNLNTSKVTSLLFFFWENCFFRPKK